MSHTTRINTVRITSMAAAQEAVVKLNDEKGLNLSFQEGGSVQLWGHTKKCAFTINVPGCQFNLGFEAHDDGTYTPVFDAHGGWLAQHIGGGKELAKTPQERTMANIGGFLQQYGRSAALEVARQSNAMVTETYDEVSGGYILQVA